MNWRRQYKSSGEYVQAYPNDADAHGSLGAALHQLGQWDKSATECRKALRLNPDDGYIASYLMADDLVLNRLDDAKAVYEQSRARKLQNGLPDSVIYVLAFAEGMPPACSSTSTQPWASRGLTTF